MNDKRLFIVGTAFNSLGGRLFFPNRHFEHIAGKPFNNLMTEKLQAIPQVGKIIVNTDSYGNENYYCRSGKVKVIDIYRASPHEAQFEFVSDKVAAALPEHAEGDHFLQLGPIFPFLKHQTIEYVIEADDTYVMNPEGDNYHSVLTIRTLNRRYFDSDTDFKREDPPNTLVEDGILYVFNCIGFLDFKNRKVGKAVSVRRRRGREPVN